MTYRQNSRLKKQAVERGDFSKLNDYVFMEHIKVMDAICAENKDKSTEWMEQHMDELLCARVCTQEEQEICDGLKKRFGRSYCKIDMRKSTMQEVRDAVGVCVDN